MFQVCEYEALQKIFKTLPKMGREVLVPALEQFFETKEATEGEYGIEEVANLGQLNSFLKEDSGHMKSLWEMPNSGHPCFFIHELEFATADLDDIYGFDDYGLPRVMCHAHQEFREEYETLPDNLKKVIKEESWGNDPGEEELEIRGRDGYTDGTYFARWCLSNSMEVDGQLEEKLLHLGHLVDKVNDKVRLNRPAAYDRSELPYPDGGRPD